MMRRFIKLGWSPRRWWDTRHCWHPYDALRFCNREAGHGGTHGLDGIKTPTTTTTEETTHAE